MGHAQIYMTPKDHKTAGMVIWITGLSGSGKTSVGKYLFSELRRENPNSLFIDGDSVRNIVGDELGHSESDRLINAQRISRMCKHFSDQGLHVICSTMSLFPEIWAWNRSNMSEYFEIYLRASIQSLAARDTRGIYQRDNLNVVGSDLSFVEPTGANLIIDTDDAGSAAIARYASIALQAIRQQNVKHKLSNTRLDS